MSTAIRNSWPLLFGVLLLMMGQGLLATLLTLRANGLGFGEGAIGFLQAGYPAGQIIGCLLAPRLVERSGHARTFGALASIASATALLHLVTFDPQSWAAMRLVTGFCYAGLFIVAESWLNGHATNRNRGALLSLYFVTQALGNAAGQLFLGADDPQAVGLFVIVSVLISLALVPMLLVNQVTPHFERPEHLSLRALFRLSPMGVSGAFLNGVSQGALYVGLPLYATLLGAGPSAAGLMIVSMTLGGVALQFPVGRLSDGVDRRHVIVGLAAAGVMVSLAAGMVGEASPLARYGLVAVLGALVLPGYSLCLAHTNDQLEPGQMIAAGGAMVLVFGLGITLGVAAGPSAIERLSPAGLYWLVAGVQGLTVATALFRLWRVPAVESRGAAMAVGQGATPVAARLNPETPFPAGDGNQLPESRRTRSSSQGSV